VKYTIDATNKKLGRVASEAAILLMGKNAPGYARHEESENTVEIINASGLSITPKKQRDTKYTSYSGYPGGLKVASMEQIIDKKGKAELVKIAVKGMLPKNKLQARMMKKLTITE